MQKPQVCVLGINVTDIEQALAFYCDKLGFTVKQQWGDEIVQLEHEGLPVILQQVEAPIELDYPRVAQSVLGFQTPDLVTTMTELKAKGVELLYDSPQPFPAGIFTAFRDPFGNVHELLQFQDN